ncbi:hypothetical protein C0993_007285 [Termitomyces sp. T159_Od127]|nr:hypothetical protein C0993_007285 [Termitomyces sp. T159_Od127]
MSLSALAISETVGYPTTTTMFNDVERLSPWPARLYIKKVSKITLYTGSAVVNGIEINYDMSNNKEPKTVVHGRKDGNVNERILTGGKCSQRVVDE